MKKSTFLGFIVGLTAGSVIGLLYAPKSGRELRKDIGNEASALLRKAEKRRDEIMGKAKDVAAALNEKGERLLAITKKYAEGKFQGTKENIEKEIVNLRNAISTAIVSYRNSVSAEKTPEAEVDDLFIDFEKETLPKFEGMGRRR